MINIIHELAFEHGISVEMTAVETFDEKEVIKIS